MYIYITKCDSNVAKPQHWYVNRHVSPVKIAICDEYYDVPNLT